MIDWSSDDDEKETGADFCKIESEAEFVTIANKKQKIQNINEDKFGKFDKFEYGQIIRWFPDRKFGFIRAKVGDVFFLQTDFTRYSRKMPIPHQKVKMLIKRNKKNDGYVAENIQVM